jgi:hypothetical protein
MAVQITPKSTQHTGLAQSMEGSVAAWLVTFQLDGDDSIHAAIPIPVAGPPTHREAQEKALKTSTELAVRRTFEETTHCFRPQAWHSSSSL